MRRFPPSARWLGSVCSLALVACSSPGDSGSGAGALDGAAASDGSHDSGSADAGHGHDGATNGSEAGSSEDAGGGAGGDATVPGSADAEAGAPPSDGGLPAGWLYTKGNAVYVSHGSAPGTPWMGRGVNMDDLFLCGYDNTLWMTSPEQTLETMASGLLGAWKPTFVRVSLGMASYSTGTSWLTNSAQYATPMTAFIESIGAHAGVYVLVTLRSDASMIGQDTVDGDPEATGLPSDATTTPDKSKFPTGTDATYVALVDSFAHDPFVLLGLSNEPGGNKLSNAAISAAMSHAVGVIRTEEDRLGVPHHIVSVQGNSWTSDIGFYAASPLPYDDVVYEVHGYPPTTSSYTYANIPVILGEYGSLPDSASFYADVEAKQIPNLAWDFEPYSNCKPDLVNVTQSATNLTPTSWGSVVQSYLLAH